MAVCVRVIGGAGATGTPQMERRELDVTKKLHVYHILYRLNLSFSNIVRHCRALQEAGSFTAKSSKLFQGYAPRVASGNKSGFAGNNAPNRVRRLGAFRQGSSGRRKAAPRSCRCADPGRRIQAFSIAEKERQTLRTKPT
jgi:hypothetical protein